MKKSELRKIYLARRKSLGQTERSEKNRQLCERFFGSFDLSEIKFLHCFLPMARTGEIDTHLIIERIQKDFRQIRIFLPRVNLLTGEIEHLEFTRQTEFVVSRWGISEPVGERLIDEKEFDAVLVPLLCFDERGYRVGYGKGFYDRFLAKCRADCQKIGLSYVPPVEEISDIHESDVKLDFCLTPNSTWIF